jgi:aminoglycoside phosphotransferase (APT) family kinase protein
VSGKAAQIDASAVRDEDAFDVAAVDAWLREHASEAVPGEGEPSVRQFTGGSSNLTYLLEYPGGKLILRRPPAGRKAASAHDMKREYDVQRSLAPVFPHVAPMVAHCDDESVIGSEFYVMGFVEGRILRGRIPEEERPSPQQARAICESVWDTLIDLHNVDPVAAGLDQLGKGHGYVGRQVAGWSERYRRAKTWNVPSFEPVMKWLDANQPDDVATCIIHNDFRLDNLVLDPQDMTKVIGVLDWEMATLGDPLMDLGGSMSYWQQADDPKWTRMMQLQPSDLPGMMKRREVVDYYCSKTGRSPDNWAFYEVFGMFRLAGIVQQIYYRYHHKQTTNPKFKRFWLVSHVLNRRCRQVIREA